MRVKWSGLLCKSDKPRHSHVDELRCMLLDPVRHHLKPSFTNNENVESIEGFKEVEK